MTFLQSWGPFAPTLLYIWLGIAYGYAYLRTSKGQKKTQISGLASIATYLLLYHFLIFRDAQENPSISWWISYGLYLCWPLILLGPFHDIHKRRTTSGYNHPTDVLFFRAPDWNATPGPVASIHGLRRTYTLDTLFLIFLTLLLAVISYIGIGLRTCGWFDIAVERSGCLRTVAIDRETIQSVAVSPDGTLLAAGGSEKTIRLYGVADGQLQRTITGHTDWVSSVAFSPDRSLIASGSWDGSVRLWRISDGSLIRVLPMGIHRTTIVVSFSPDGTLLAAVARNIDVHLWRVADGALVRSIPSVGGDVAFSPDGALLAVEQPEYMITLWQLPEGRLLRRLAGSSYVTSFAFAPDGRTLADASSGDETIKIWRVADGVLLRTIPGPARSNLAFSPDGTLIASGGMTNDFQHLYGLVEVWNIAENKVAHVWEGHQRSVNSVAFSPDGTFLVSGSSWETIRLWRIKP